MGVQLLARVNAANYWDEFTGAAGAIAGRVMPRGGLTWGAHHPSGGSMSDRPVIDGTGGLRAPAAGAGGAMATVNPGSARVTVVTKISKLAAAPTMRLTFRATDSETHYFVGFRVGRTNEYCIGARSAGADAGHALRAGVAAAVGDRVRLDVLPTGTADLYVNGIKLGSAELKSFADRTHVGVYANGGNDSITTLDDFGIYV